MSALSIRFGAATALPVEVLLSMIPSLPRAALDRLTERLIDRLDELDGDLDLEPNGDELDGSMSEDEVHEWRDFGPGDPNDAEEDDDTECEARDDGCGPIPVRRGVVWGYEGEIE